MKVLLVGDTHGNDRFFAAACREAKEMECEGLIQLGDFGYWEHYPQGKGFLKWVARQLKENDLWCWWLDGNHENHPLLWSTYGYDVTQMSKIRPRLYYMPRGYRFELDGVTCMAVGGAYSVDKPGRTIGKSWWPEELLRMEDVEAACVGGPVDMMFTHDCPYGVNIPVLESFPKDQFPESRMNRQMLASIVKEVKPRVLVHGHYHDRYSAFYDFRLEDGWHRVQIEGLAHDFSYGRIRGKEGNTLVFDTENFPRG